MKGRQVTEGIRGKGMHHSSSQHASEVEGNGDAGLHLPSIAKERGEIAVFDADRYFAGTGIKAADRALKDEADDEVEAREAKTGGELPLSPFPEFSINKGKQNLGHAEAHTARSTSIYRGSGAVGHRWEAKSKSGAISDRGSMRSPGRMHKESRWRAMANTDHHLSAAAEQAVVASLNHHTPPPPPPPVCSSLEPDFITSASKSSTKYQPFSPSTRRLASFLARFKLSTATDSKYNSNQSLIAPALTATTTSSSSSPNPFSLPPISPKPPSPRGRFLRALTTSSSSGSLLLHPLRRLHHPGASPRVTASTPVSPAGSDPYSPITNSATTTPTSRKNPRHGSRSRSSSHKPSYHEDGTSPSLPTTHWRREVDSPTTHSSSGGLNQLKQKLKSYLNMSEKSQRSREDIAVMARKKERNNIHDRSLGVKEALKLEERVQQRGYHKAIASKQPMTNRSGTKDHTNNGRAHSILGDVNTSLPSSRQKKDKVRSMPSPARDQAGKIMGHRGGEWRQMQEELDDDIEVAERLLKVVREHQSSINGNHMNSMHSSSSYNKNNGYAKHDRANHRGGAVIRPDKVMSSASRKAQSLISKNAMSMSPFGSPARIYGSKQQVADAACPYDSDSSSDLFEIETMQAFSINGLYMPRDLPVYDTSTTVNSLKSPVRIK